MEDADEEEPADVGDEKRGGVSADADVGVDRLSGRETGSGVDEPSSSDGSGGVSSELLEREDS